MVVMMAVSMVATMVATMAVWRAELTAFRRADSWADK